MVRLDDRRVTLAIVGDGEAEEQVTSCARAANATLGRPSVVLLGQMVDPRAAYDAADIVLGMGHSALRAMAFAKPLIVLGDGGFAVTLEPETLPMFAYDGIYGVGDGGDAAAPISEELRALMDDPQLRTRLGAWGRSVAIRHFSMERAANVWEETYAAAMSKPWSRSTVVWMLCGWRDSTFPAKLSFYSAVTSKRAGQSIGHQLPVTTEQRRIGLLEMVARRRRDGRQGSAGPRGASAGSTMRTPAAALARGPGPATVANGSARSQPAKLL